MADCIVPDTSVVIDGRVSARVASGEFEGKRVVVPEAVVAELTTMQAAVDKISRKYR